MSKISKKDLVYSLCSELGMSSADANKVMEVVLKKINQSLLNGDDVVLLHTGTLSRVNKKGGSYFGGEVIAEDRYIVKFAMSRTLQQDLEDVKSGKSEQRKALDDFRNSLKKKKK